MIERVVVLVDEHDHRRAHVVLQTSIATAHEKHSALLNIQNQLGIDAGIAVLKRIPLTPTGKPDRMHLRKLLNAQHKHTETLIHLQDLT
jgi:yersiniabactin salicyl-AMP ligase